MRRKEEKNEENATVENAETGIETRRLLHITKQIKTTKKQNKARVIRGNRKYTG